MTAASPRGRRWEVFCQLVFRTYGDTCWCGHGGARQVDHVRPVADRPDLAYDLSNCRPVHGSPGNPCAECSAACGQKIYCNQLRGAMSVERARRIIAERAAANSGKRPSPPASADTGRAW